MQLRVLGAHNLESRTTRMEAHLIDGVLALDAGSLTRALTFEEQSRVRALILTHRHFDHVRDLPILGLTLRDLPITVEVYGIQDTLDFVSDKLLDGALYPDPRVSPSPENPTFHLNVVEPYQEFTVLDYTAMAVPVPHSVPAAGFLISSGGSSLFYTGDAGEGLSTAWKHVSPGLLLSEVTFGNQNPAAAKRAGHLTPFLLKQSLDDFQEEHGYLPRVIASHVSPDWDEAVRAELADVSREMGVEIEVAYPDMVVTV